MTLWGDSRCTPIWQYSFGIERIIPYVASLPGIEKVLLTNPHSVPLLCFCTVWTIYLCIKWYLTRKSFIIKTKLGFFMHIHAIGLIFFLSSLHLISTSFFVCVCFRGGVFFVFFSPFYQYVINICILMFMQEMCIIKECDVCIEILNSEINKTLKSGEKEIKKKRHITCR